MPRPPQLLRRISPNEFRDYVKSLSHDVMHALIFYRQYVDLNAATAEYVKEMNNSPAFWNLTMSASLAAARSALYRAYDFDGDGVNLYRLLAFIEDHVPKPEKNQPPIIEQSEIDADRALVSRTDPLVSVHVRQRNKEFAHKDFDYEKQTVKKQITHGELKELIERAVRILNKYADAILHQTWAKEMWGQSDYKYVLEAVRHHNAAVERQFEIEEEAYIRGTT